MSASNIISKHNIGSYATIHASRLKHLTSFLALINLQQYVKGFLMTLN